MSLPHNLQLVIDFVNTLDVEAGQDRTDSPEHLGEWLDEQGLRPGNALTLGAGELEQAVSLRESLRRVLIGHNHHEEPADAAQHLEDVAAQGQLGVRFGADGSVEIAPRAEGYPAVLAELLVPVARAAMDGSWARVKACQADDCQWAFYDASRNRSGRWCDMAVCGNREKVRAYRSKRSA
jgi:predicted RNA-binding Zn ribbon-like protein